MTQGSKTISVIIPALNAASTLRDTLESLGSQILKPLEVIVVDNGSTDGTVSCAQQWALVHPNLSVRVATESKPGPSAARNQGVEVSEGDILVFLDSDCVAPPDWLQKISVEMEKGSAAVGGPCRPDPSVSAIEKYAALSWFSPQEAPESLDSPFTHRFLLGANMAVSRDAWEKVGGFDEALQTGEDLELSMHLKQGGIPVVLTPALAVTHHGASSVSKRIRRAFHHGKLQAKITQRNFQNLLVISVPGKTWKAPFPVTIAMEPLSLTKTLVALCLIGSVQPFLAVAIFLILLILWECRMVVVFVRQCVPMTLKGGWLISFGWACARLAMELGRLAGSIRYGVLCW